MKKFIIYDNLTYDDGEVALYNETDDKIVYTGDDYHTKSEYKIDGYLKALEDFGLIDYEVERVGIRADHELFSKFGFYDGSDD